MKSTTLGALWRCLSGADGELESISYAPYWLANVEISGTHSGIAWTASHDARKGIFDGQHPAPVLYIDASSETSAIIAQLRKDGSPGDLIEGIDPSNFDSRQLELLSFVLRRSYSESVIQN